METEPLERIDDHQSGETPEDVAILYSWANLQGAKYRDFSANRREYRAQMRHRAAEQLRLMELRAQSEAEAAAAQAEAEAAAAHAEADAATVKLAASRSMPSAAPEDILEEKEVEQVRKASLREAAQQARRAAAERLEAARRAEAAALADSIARREEREIAEAQASALRQAAQYHDSEMKSRQMMAQHPENQVPGHLTDPYSPQILAEGEYYDGPGTPPSELEASRFRVQREYIERATGAELPPFKMPPYFSDDRQAGQAQVPDRQFSDKQHFERLAAERAAAERAAEFARAAEPVNNGRDFGPRRISEMNTQDRDYYMERHLREDRNASLPYRREPAAEVPKIPISHSSHQRFSVPSTPYSESQGPVGDAGRTARPEVVSRIPEDRRETWERNEYAPERPELRPEPRVESRPEPRPEPRFEQYRDRRSDAAYDGSLLSPAAPRPVQSMSDYAQPAVPERMQRRPEPQPEPVDLWKAAQRNLPGEMRQAPSTYASERSPGPQYVAGYPHENDQALPVTPRPSGSWLRRISAAENNNDLRPQPARTENRHETKSFRPSVEATYSDGLTDDTLAQPESQPSGFRPPWLTQAQAPRPSGSRKTPAPPAVPEKQTPRWLYPDPPVQEAPAPVVAHAATTVVPQANSPQQYPHQAHTSEDGRSEHKAEATSSLQASQEAVASRWFALKGVFARPETDVTERHSPREKTRAASVSVPVPTIAVYSLAGGVGKTSLVATLGRALSSLGEKVLLADTTSHGLLPFYFGAKELHPGVVRTFAPPNGSADAPVYMVSYALDAPGANSDAQRKVIDDLIASSKQANRVLIDMNANCSWMIEKLAGLKPTVLVPLAADMNSIISLQAVERSFSSMRSADGEPLRPVYLLNQFDASLPLHLDVREVLRQQLGERLLPFVVRRAAGVSEALAEGMTIVDYDPDSSTTQDYIGLANWIRAAAAPATAGFRNLRWSER